MTDQETFDFFYCQRGVHHQLQELERRKSWKAAAIILERLISQDLLHHWKAERNKPGFAQYKANKIKRDLNLEVSFNPFAASASGASGSSPRAVVNSTPVQNNKTQEDLINEETERRLAAALKKKQEEEAALKRLSRRDKAAKKGNFPNNRRSGSKSQLSKADLVTKANLVAEKAKKKADEADLNAQAIAVGISKVTLIPKGPPLRSRSHSPGATSLTSYTGLDTSDKDSDSEIERIRTKTNKVTPEEENRLLFPPPSENGTPLDNRIDSIVNNGIDPGNPTESMETS